MDAEPIEAEWRWSIVSITVKPVLIGHSEIGKTKVLKANGSLMKVSWSILQYFDLN